MLEGILTEDLGNRIGHALDGVNRAFAGFRQDRSECDTSAVSHLVPG